MSGAIATAAIIGGGALAGSAISAHAAGKASSTQAAAADNSAQLQYQASQQALAFQKQQYAQSQANAGPWLQSGASGLANLDYLLGITPPNTQGQIAGGPLTPNQAGSGLPGAHPVGPQPGGSPQQQGSGLNGAHPVGPQQYGSGPIGVNARPAVSAVPGAANGPMQPFSSQPAPGTTDLGSTVNPSLGTFGSLMQPYSQQFVAPTSLTEQNDPGYQARLALGTDALQRSAAARGGVLTGGTAKALDTYAQDYASNEYGNVYGRALNTFNSNYNQYEQNQTNQYNRLASLAGIGQQTAQQLGTLGNQTAQGVSSNLLGTAQNMGQDYQNAAAANASGYYNTAQAINGGIGGALGAYSQYNQLRQLQGANSNPAVYGGGSLYGV